MNNGRRYSPEEKARVLEARRRGLSVKEIARHFGMSTSTVSTLVRSVALSTQAKARLLYRETSNLQRFVAHRRLLDTYRIARERAYHRGLTSNPDAMDALCVGLYWGEGSKFASLWGFCNSDPRTVQLMVDWAIRAGQPPGAFRAQVRVHPEDSLADEEIRAFWSRLGIPLARLRIYRTRSPTSKHSVKGRTPYGTCSLYSVKGGAWLYSFMEGQRDAIIGSVAKKQGS